MRFVISILSLALSTLASAETLTPATLQRDFIQPLLKARTGLYNVRQVDRNTLLLTSGMNDREWIGHYRIQLTDSQDTGENAPAITAETAIYRGVPIVRLLGYMAWPRDKTEGLTDALRSLIRGDFFLHPMLTPPGRKPELSDLQVQVKQELVQRYQSDSTRGQASKELLILPTGIGKTNITAFTLKDIIGLQKTPFKVVFVVQNQEILDEATLRLQQILGISPAQVHRVYGENSKAVLFPQSASLIAVSRTTYHKQLLDFEEEREKFKGRVFYVFDEAQHLGREDGEFAKILEAIDRNMHPGDLLLGLSATPWHKDTDLIQNIFKDNVVTALLTESEKNGFLASRQLIYMARLQLFRAIAQGYLTPLRAYRQIRYLDTEGQPLLSRDFLNDWEFKFKDLNEADRFTMLKREVTLHQPLIRAMIKEIRATIRKDAEGKNVAWNRGLIFVPSIAHAEIYAFLLNKLGSSDPKQPIQAKAYHSRLDPEQRTKTMDWFKDELVTPSRDSRVGHLDLKQREVHKYLFAIRTLGEGFDEPRVNHLILAKTYNDDDLVGMRELLQNIGRATRIAYGKTDFTVSDFTGDMRRLIFSGLSQSLINRFFIKGAERDFEPYPESRHKVESEVHVDAETLDPEKFQSTPVPVPVQSLARNEIVPPEVQDEGPLIYAPDSSERMRWLDVFNHPLVLELMRDGLSYKHDNLRKWLNQSAPHNLRALYDTFLTSHSLDVQTRMRILEFFKIFNLEDVLELRLLDKKEFLNGYSYMAFSNLLRVKPKTSIAVQETARSGPDLGVRLHGLNFPYDETATEFFPMSRREYESWQKRQNRIQVPYFIRSHTTYFDVTDWVSDLATSENPWLRPLTWKEWIEFRLMTETRLGWRTYDDPGDYLVQAIVSGNLPLDLIETPIWNDYIQNTPAALQPSPYNLSTIIDISSGGTPLPKIDVARYQKIFPDKFPPPLNLKKILAAKNEMAKIPLLENGLLKFKNATVKPPQTWTWAELLVHPYGMRQLSVLKSAEPLNVYIQSIRQLAPRILDLLALFDESTWSHQVPAMGMSLQSGQSRALRKRIALTNSALKTLKFPITDIAGLLTKIRARPEILKLIRQTKIGSMTLNALWADENSKGSPAEDGVRPFDGRAPKADLSDPAGFRQRLAKLIEELIALEPSLGELSPFNNYMALRNGPDYYLSMQSYSDWQDSKDDDFLEILAKAIADPNYVGPEEVRQPLEFLMSLAGVSYQHPDWATISQIPAMISRSRAAIRENHGECEENLEFPTLGASKLSPDSGASEVELPSDEKTRALHLTPVLDLDLSVRTTNSLLNADIRTLGDLVRHTPADLMNVPNFGRKSLNEVEYQLSELGLSLKKN